MKRSIATGSLLVLAACSAMPTGPAVPDTLKPEATEGMTATLAARGVQIYECRTRKDDAQATEWAFVAPEAELFDAHGRRVGRHYAGPHWESNDGSKLLGSAKARADAPRPGAIPWLLLSTRSVGPAGAFAPTTSIQRVNTTGGVAPAAEACTAATLGQQARVAYTADYAMFARR